jgi:hypothetical protein
MKRLKLMLKNQKEKNKAFCIKKSLKIDQNQFYETMEMI